MQDNWIMTFFTARSNLFRVSTFEKFDMDFTIFLDLWFGDTLDNFTGLNLKMDQMKQFDYYLNWRFRQKNLV